MQKKKSSENNLPLANDGSGKLHGAEKGDENWKMGNPRREQRSRSPVRHGENAHLGKRGSFDRDGGHY